MVTAIPSISYAWTCVSGTIAGDRPTCNAGTAEPSPASSTEPAWRAGSSPARCPCTYALERRLGRGSPASAAASASDVRRTERRDASMVTPLEREELWLVRRVPNGPPAPAAVGRPAPSMAGVSEDLARAGGTLAGVRACH